MIVDKSLSKAKFEKETSSLVSNPEQYAKTGLRLLRIEFPILEVALWWRKHEREILLRVIAEDYNYLPIYGYWIDQNGSPLRKGSGRVPIDLGFHVEDSHPHNLQRSWFCFKGWREYHDHESHQDIAWPSLRDNKQYRMMNLILQLLSDLNRPGVNAI
ncbi:MAG: hypothetical protein HYV24_06685 [Deltaproteobacteria bacterium]|nr:hypothetical protein [Deltaproteobacteria bacterium]